MDSAQRTSAIPVPMRTILCKGSTIFAHLSRGPILDKMTFVISVRLESKMGVIERESATVATGAATSARSNSGLRSIAIRLELS